MPTGGLSRMDTNQLGIIISAVALIVSVVSLISTRKTQNKLLEFEKVHARLSEIQITDLSASNALKFKADVRADLFNGSIYLENKGPACASNINIAFETESDNHIIGSELEHLPIEKLDAGRNFKLIGSYDTCDAPPVFTVIVSWENEDETKQSNREVLKC